MTPNRRGMTMIEMLIALALFGVIAASSLAMFRRQSQAFQSGNERAAALQNGQFALEMLSRDLRTSGAGAPDQQPGLVYAGVDAVAFNADYTTNVANDVFAVYYDPAAPTGAVTALLKSQKFTLPGTAFAYPDSSYSAGGGNSPAETIIFYFRPDSMTPRTDDFVLMRQVNRQPAELVSRNLLRSGSTPFLEYVRLSVPANGTPTMAPIAAASLPLRHSVPLHLSAGDTAALARIDSIRGVRVTLTVTNGLTGAAERQRQLTRLIPLPNAGLAAKRSCGDAPLLGTGINAAAVTNAGVTIARLTWSQSTDESGGERDVVRYVIWRKKTSDASWGDPLLSIPAGAANYSYDDATVEPGESYQYQLAAQDCTPLLSNQATSGVVAIP